MLNENPLTSDLILRAAAKLTEEISFGSNRMASSDYRRTAAYGLAQQILMEATEHEYQI
jgi:CO/xanthine dehydrogenase FAD-binding subunit